VTVTAALGVLNVAGKVRDVGDTLYVHPGNRASTGERMPRAGALIAPVHGVPTFTCPLVKPAPEYIARSATKPVPDVLGQAGSEVVTDSRNVANI